MHSSNALLPALHVVLNNVGKKFGKQYIFKGINYRFEAGGRYAITGANGSGKSTLLKVIAGILTPNLGTAEWQLNSKPITVEEVFKHIAFCSPYAELPEELTLRELLQFHQHTRTLHAAEDALIKELAIDPDKEIRNYSSGMKQRVKLALAFYTQSSILLLDEPTANLDEHWSNWYLQKISEALASQLIIVCSNVPAEYGFCKAVLHIDAFKV